jgi:hypothetical protein
LINLFEIDLNMIASFAIVFGIIIYVGYVNTSIRELKKRVEELENKIGIDKKADEELK